MAQAGLGQGPVVLCLPLGIVVPGVVRPWVEPWTVVVAAGLDLAPPIVDSAGRGYPVPDVGSLPPRTSANSELGCSTPNAGLSR